MENKQTAVKWLYERLQTEPYLTLHDFQHAKQMEKEQIVKAFDDGCEDVNRIGIEYYQEIYESNL